MNFSHRHASVAFLFFALATFSIFAVNTNVHTTWLWHLHQPIYWPDRAPNNHTFDHYQNAWDTIQLGNAHPTDTSLSTVFGVADRVNAYQAGPKNSLGNLLGYANAGVQVNYSGALMENVQSLASAGQLGYGNGWNGNFSTAHSWTTSSGKPRMDLVNFTYHHALAPLLSDETLEMELRIHQRQQQIFWGTTSRGYFPTETCFSERMIPILNKVGISWSVIANTHLARTCADFPVVTGSGGEQCDLPNLADQINPPQGAGNYRRLSIDRGCSPAQVAPFGFQMHYARYVDPNSGAESKLIVMPSDQVFGWKDSYSTWDLGLIDFVAQRNDTNKPSLVFCAHDGDNAWSGGSSYYNEWVPNMASQAVGKGYEPTTIEQFINDFAPNTNDIVHVEDGGWVFADSDFGSPMFINWHWPPSYSSNGVNVVDPSLGVSDKADNWRVIIATENRVKTAQQISGITPRIDQVRDPGSFSATPNAVEIGWHYYLGSLDSGFVYYGCTADECLRAIVAQSNAVRNVNSILSNTSADTTPPTVFIPQRHPWNPGGTNFGVQYGYKTYVAPNSDFWIWTYAYDVSGITNVGLFIRNNGTNPPTSDQFKTYAGGALADAWSQTNMTLRVTGNSSGYTPQYMADYYYSKVTGISNAFCDYYVSATDAHGNIFKSPIQHVFVGAGIGASSGGNSGNANSFVVNIAPTNPVAGNSVTVQYVATGRSLASAANVYLHLGWNNYSTIVSPDLAMTFSSASNWWQCTFNITNTATNFNCTFNNGSGTWDNNSSANWNFAVSNSVAVIPPVTNLPAFVMDGSFDSSGYWLASNGMVLYGAVRGTTLYVATWSPGNSGPNDHFVFVTDQLLLAGTAAPWAKTGTVSVSTSKPFLAAESQGTYVSWFANNAATNWPCAKSATNSGALEGALDLNAAFGYLPTNIFLCAAAYQTTNGGALAAQCPAAVTANGNIETNEFLMLPISALRDSLGNGTLDLCDPARGFKINSTGIQNTNRILNFTVMPGRNYQVQFATSLNSAWTNVPSTNFAAPPQMNLNFTDAPPAGTPQRFYRVKLLP
jgi:Starch/carbohydrate-binding module (family 53)/Glycosyl hydrolase family 57